MGDGRRLGHDRSLRPRARVGARPCRELRREACAISGDLGRDRRRGRRGRGSAGGRRTRPRGACAADGEQRDRRRAANGRRRRARDGERPCAPLRCRAGRRPHARRLRGARLRRHEPLVAQDRRAKGRGRAGHSRRHDARARSSPAAARSGAVAQAPRTSPLLPASALRRERLQAIFPRWRGSAPCEAASRRRSCA